MYKILKGVRWRVRCPCSRALSLFSLSFYSLLYSLYRYRSLHLSLSSLSICIADSESVIHATLRYKFNISFFVAWLTLPALYEESVIFPRHCSCMVDPTSLIWSVRNLYRFIVRAWLTLPALYGVSVIFAASLFVHG